MRNKRLNIIAVFVILVALILPIIPFSTVSATAIILAANDSSSGDKATAGAGHVCPGTADQTMINSFLTTGNSVELLAGTYNISGYIVPVSNSNLIGASETGTILNFSTGSVYISDVSNSTIGNFTISGTTSSSSIAISSSATTPSGITIYNITSTSSGSADADFEIYANNYTVSNVVFINCDAVNPNGYGYLLTGTGAGAIINNVTFFVCSVENAGIAVTRNGAFITGYDVENLVSADKISFIDCKSHESWESGFNIDSTNTAITNCVFLDNLAENAGQSPSAYYGSGILVAASTFPVILNGNTGTGNLGGSYTHTSADISAWNGSSYNGYTFPHNLVLDGSQVVTRKDQSNCSGIAITTAPNTYELVLYTNTGGAVSQTLTLPNGNTYHVSFSTYDIEYGVTGTTPSPVFVTNLKAIPFPTTMSLSWVRAVGYSQTVIRYSTTTYPATIADGTLVYSGTGINYIQTGLTAGTTYYYTAWGYNGATYTSDASAAKVLMTTIVGTVPASTTIPTPSQPTPSAPSSTNWFAGLQPFSGFIKGFETSWGMNTDTMPFTIGIIILLVVGVGLYLKTKSPLIAIVADFVVDFGLIAMGLLSTWTVGVVIAFGLGVWALENIWI